MCKKFKCVSHVERVLNRDLGKHARNHEVPVSEVIQTKRIVDGNRVVTKAEKVIMDPRKNVEGFKVSDFSIEMLEATGTIANLKNVTLDGGSMDMADAFAINLDSVEE